MTNMDDQFTPEEHLTSDLGNLAIGWQELGINPDDFITCAECGHNVLLDEDEAEDTGPLSKACRCSDDDTQIGGTQ